ncbi:diacylglycerol kinase [Pleomorphomonas diazotrophica]|uniref:Dihydrofolate reductase n=1 Tax=Pleomorphomonas diazotrophica TaxID=1166257 RepID=A0A1I4VF79_9HYPH|nr:dihydrofolate reductase [Pleomorphomonas diazotrophica]PKR91048.1 diacylglycerol kinase [Pleomorphomonas diazotrophica]SFM99887.1 dihydrofolate reductase [Pleomorphomonas diazotrophica]
MTEPFLDIVVAMAENGIIGRDGDMPWHLSTDLKHFKALTLGRPMVMGRKTFEAIGKPLPGRETLVVSRDPAFAPDGVTVLSDLDAALEAARASAVAKGVPSFVVAGGGVLYAATIERADRLFVTRVAAAPEGDTRFPPIDPARWELTASEPMVRGPRDSADATFETWTRRR